MSVIGLGTVAFDLIAQGKSIQTEIDEVTLQYHFLRARYSNIAEVQHELDRLQEILAVRQVQVNEIYSLAIRALATVKPSQLNSM